MSLSDKNKHIPTAEIRQDIIDTENEIMEFKRQEEGYRLIGDKMSIFRADGKRTGIVHRKAFVAKLKIILKERESTVHGQDKTENSNPGVDDA